MKKILVLLAISFGAVAQKTENVILITLDGLRWQEVFTGADSALLFDESYTESISRTAGKFWEEEGEVRREILMPFLWSTVKKNGVIIGNKKLGSKMDIKNPYGFSYPGYNEILTGYPDDSVDSNDKVYNKNITVLEFLNNKKRYKDQVAAFATWNVFPFIINDQRSGVYVNAAGKSMEVTETKTEALLNEIQNTVPSLASQRFDFVTYYLAQEYLEKKQPKVLFIGFDETDEFAHEGKYRDYLYAANSIDKYISKIWEYCQSNPKYKDKTTLIITSDHGRGQEIKDQWRSHGKDVIGCRSIWLAAMGPDTPAIGEMKEDHQVYQNQIAATVAKLLGEKFENGHQIGEAIDLIVK